MGVKGCAESRCRRDSRRSRPSRGRKIFVGDFAIGGLWVGALGRRRKRRVGRVLCGVVCVLCGVCVLGDLATRGAS